jgi:putative ABC transport system permease protein
LYMALPTLSKFLAQPGDVAFNELHFNVAEHPDDRAHIRDVAARLRSLVESNSVHVDFTRVPPPNQHFLAAATRAMLLLLATLGVASLFMGSLLIVNTVAALLVQQTRQIAVMKTFGAQTGQLLGMYCGMVLVFGSVAVVLAIPLSMFTTSLVVHYVVGVVNFDVTSTAVPVKILVLEVVAGLLVPLMAASVPIRRATGVSVRQALTSTGLDAHQFGKGLFDRLIGNVRHLPGPTLLPIRNVFRRKARSGLTLTALSLGGACFISVLTVGDSLEVTTASDLQSIHYDLEVSFPTPPATDPAQDVALAVPGVQAVESWGMRSAYRLNPDGSESTALSVVGPPARSSMFAPIIVAGRWLRSDDTNVAVLGTDFSAINPDLHLGSPVDLKLEGRESTWTVVGIARSRSFGLTNIGPSVFVPQAALSRATGQVRRTDSLRVVLDEHDAATQARVGSRVLEALSQARVPTLGLETFSNLQSQRRGPDSIVVNFLLAMAAMLTVVSGLGLAGTTSINVLERTRELGIMRAIGASPAATFRIVVTEALVIAAIGWLLGTILSVPMSYWLTELVGRELVDEAVAFSYAWSAPVIWLLIACGLAVAASSVPAWRAARMTVHAALAYE